MQSCSPARVSVACSCGPDMRVPCNKSSAPGRRPHFLFSPRVLPGSRNRLLLPPPPKLMPLGMGMTSYSGGVGQEQGRPVSTTGIRMGRSSWGVNGPSGPETWAEAAVAAGVRGRERKFLVPSASRVMTKGSWSKASQG